MPKYWSDWLMAEVSLNFAAHVHVRSDLPAIQVAQGLQLLDFSRISNNYLGSETKKGALPDCMIARADQRLCCSYGPESSFLMMRLIISVFESCRKTKEIHR